MECTENDCSLQAVFHIADVENRQCFSEFHLCEEHAQILLTAPKEPLVVATPRSRPAGGEVQIDLDRIVISEIHDEQVLYMREVDGGSTFPFLTGIFEATAIDRMVKGVKASRPLTHHAMASLITALDGRLERVVITSFREHIYFAELQIRQGGRLVCVDIRLSDGIAISILHKAPIWIAHEVFQVALGN